MSLLKVDHVKIALPKVDLAKTALPKDDHVEIALPKVDVAKTALSKSDVKIALPKLYFQMRN